MTDHNLDEPRDDAQEQYGNISRPLEEWERPSDEVVAALKRLSGADLSYATFNRTDFSDSDPDAADFSDADLSGTVLPDGFERDKQ